MRRAVVLKMYGDTQIGEAITDGVTKVIEMDAASIAAVRAECDRLRALNDIRAYGDTIRLDAACKALDVKYPEEQHSRLYEVVLGVWGLIWYCIFEIYDYFSNWNRSE